MDTATVRCDAATPAVSTAVLMSVKSCPDAPLPRSIPASSVKAGHVNPVLKGTDGCAAGAGKENAMSHPHVTRHQIQRLEWIAEGGFAIAVAALALISLATLVYAWFLA